MVMEPIMTTVMNFVGVNSNLNMIPLSIFNTG